MFSCAVLLFSAALMIGRCSKVDYYVKLIENQRHAARNYEFPEDAGEYRPTDEEMTWDFGTYDYIVVGSGSAGSVVAARLSEWENRSVLLLEAGSFENNYTDVPGEYGYVLFSPYNWGFKTAPQTAACLGMIDRVCPYPRGRGVGGSSIINTLIYARGNPGDFDRWAREGNPGWSYEEVLPFFKKSETSNLPRAEKEYHGHKGPLSVERAFTRSPLAAAFLDANREIGKEVLDYNGKDNLGVSLTQLNTFRGRRHSTARAFVDPVLDRKNLRVMTQSYVTKVLVEGKAKVARGVEFAHGGRKFMATASREVILSAGAISTAHILLLSGLGPRRHLREYGIEVVEDLAVGENLLEHPTFYGLYINTNYTEPARDLRDYVKDFLDGHGSVTVPNNQQAVAFHKTSDALHGNAPNVELLFVPANSFAEMTSRIFRYTNATADALFSKTDPARSFAVYVIALQALSKGTVRLKSRDAFQHPIVDPRYLTDPRDLDTLFEGVQVVFRLLRTQPFRRLDAKISVLPLPACENYPFSTKAYWYCAIRQVTMNLYHPVATCRMGPRSDKGAVVDHRLRVHGVKNLRVADASVIPFTLAGHTNAAVIMVGEKAANLITKGW